LRTQSGNENRKKTASLRVQELVVFAMLGTVMFASKIIMEVLPNIHLLGMLTMTYTLVLRKKALIPIYIYVMLNGLYAGFHLWWIPYLYVWTILWGITMLLPKRMPKKFGCVVYPIVCCLHGLSFGILYAPAQALLFGMNFEQMMLWILTGSLWDVVHGVGNLFAGLLVLPLSEILKKLLRKQGLV
jgi:energy-coupling factor transport system substrate-specific component